MLERNGGLKDINLNTSNLPQIYRKESVHLSYEKTDKLITALYMVTDIIDSHEPLRLQLRTLGLKILSDIKTIKRSNISDIQNSVSTIMSFIGIASNIGLISEMNSGILKNEFSMLIDSLKESLDTVKNEDSWLQDFMKTDPQIGDQARKMRMNNSVINPVRIGVQKGGTLLQALGGINGSFNKNSIGHTARDESRQNFEILKNKRREEIISIIKDKKNSTGINGSTITDIKNNSKGHLIDCSEKTLQRELVSMVKEGLLKKTGNKRWSQYLVI